MKYMGSKAKHAKEILPIILKDRKVGQYFVDLFCGGFNIIDKVSGLRIANDINYYLIELFKAIQDGWEPPSIITEQEYKEIQQNKDKYEPCLVGFVGFGCSYSGKWFGGYARGNDNKGNKRNYALESKKNLLKQYEGIQGIEIYNLNYYEVDIPKNSIIYLDPPYANTTKYKDKFDHDKFWDWVREKSTEHKIFISEYNAPDDFECLWSKKVNNTLTKDTGSKQGIEKLWTIKQNS